MQVIVIGAGPAGLTAAISIAKAGHAVTIVESVPQITYIGAGIQVTPNSSRVLRNLGVDKFIQRYCTDAEDMRMMRWKDGLVLSQVPLKKPAEEEYKSPYWHIHRADLHRGLLECAKSLGIPVHLDQRVLTVDPEIPAIETKGGRRFTGDLIVAADGLHSSCREIVLGHPKPPIPTGQMVYRITLPAKRLEGIPELEELITVPRSNHWIGPHGTALSYLLQGEKEKLLNLVCTCDVTMPDGINQRPATSEGAREAYKDWDPRIDQILSYVDTVLEWRLYTHEEVPTWTHASSHVTLIGDAAHAMTPYLAQGAAMAIEDAAVLGGILSQPDYCTPETLPQALAMYEKLRIKRTAKIAEKSVSSRWFTQMEDGEEQRARDEWLLAHPGIWEDHINIRADKQFSDELFGYDAYAALEEALAEARKARVQNGSI